jgi:hypothetical protein
MIGKGRNFTRKFLWDTPEKCSEVPAYWSQSLVDCYIWYHKKLIELADTNGTFFDNLSIVFSDNVAAGLAYVRDDGSVQAKSNMFARRQLTKRLHTTGWLAGKPPYYVPNGCGIDTSFAEANMPIEGIWYVYSKDGDFIDSVNDMDFIRAACLSRGIPMLVASSQVQMHPYGQAGTNPRPTRSLFAVIVLNDLAIDHGRNINPAVAKPIMDLLDREIGFFSPENQAKFHPWWDNAGVFHFSEESNDGARTVEPKQLFGSVYTRSGKAAVWLVNTGEKDATSDIWLDDQALLGKQAARLRDAETGETMVRVPDGKGAKTGSTWAHVWVRPHDFRMLVLE